MDNCQPELEPGCITPDAPEPPDPTEDSLNHESENHASPSSTSSTSSKASNQKASNRKRKYVPTPFSGKKPRAQTDFLLNEMKETMNSLKTLASDTSSREILNFLRGQPKTGSKRRCIFTINGCIGKTIKPKCCLTNDLFYARYPQPITNPIKPSCYFTSDLSYARYP